MWAGVFSSLNRFSLLEVPVTRHIEVTLFLYLSSSPVSLLSCIYFHIPFMVCFCLVHLSSLPNLSFFSVSLTVSYRQGQSHLTTQEFQETTRMLSGPCNVLCFENESLNAEAQFWERIAWIGTPSVFTDAHTHTQTYTCTQRLPCSVSAEGTDWKTEKSEKVFL